MFNSKYPIICAPMNRVSDLKLALACAEAGIVPSLIPDSYGTIEDFKNAAIEVKKKSKDLQVSYALEDIVTNVDLILELGISHIEIFEYNLDSDQHSLRVLYELRKQGVKIILKVIKPDIIPVFLDVIDAVTYKGSDAAGRSAVGVDLLKEIPLLKVQYPGLNIIASGGIGNKKDIDKFLDAGACAVSIGTLFAMSADSSVPDTIKNKLLDTSSTDIKRLKTGARQRAVIFKEEQVDDFNNTQGLSLGLTTGTQGHIFVGNAIDSITDILTVKEIVNYLTA